MQLTARGFDLGVGSGNRKKTKQYSNVSYGEPQPLVRRDDIQYTRINKFSLKKDHAPQGSMNGVYVVTHDRLVMWFDHVCYCEVCVLCHPLKEMLETAFDYQVFIYLFFPWHLYCYVHGPYIQYMGPAWGWTTRLGKRGYCTCWLGYQILLPTTGPARNFVLPTIGKCSWSVFCFPSFFFLCSCGAWGHLSWVGYVLIVSASLWRATHPLVVPLQT